jgi:hypothetical protein
MSLHWVCNQCPFRHLCKLFIVKFVYVI